MIGARLRTACEETFWTAPATWFRGQTVFCLGSGPSFTPSVADRIKGRAALAVNSSCRFAPWAAVLYFTDHSWFLGETPDGILRRDIVADWPGLVISTSRGAKRDMPGKVNRVRAVLRPDFPPPGSAMIRQGVSSGHTAIAALIGLGAPRIILVGFDMKEVDGKEHCHDEYTGPRVPTIYQQSFLPGFAGWHKDALKVGVEIFNATPGSALKEFPMMDLDEALR